MDPTTDKILVELPKKLVFTDNQQVTVTAMTYTILRESEKDENPEGFMAIATSEFSLILLKISKTGAKEVI